MDQSGYFGTTIRVESFSFVSFTELAPLLDELNARYFHVEASVTDFEPPAAGFSEIAIAIIVTAPVAVYLSGFLKAWAAEDAKDIRRKLLEVMRKSKQSPSGRRYFPVRIGLGGVRFYLHEDLTDSELVDRLKAAQDFAASLPEELFAGNAGPGEYGMFWDRNTSSWRGSIYNYGGEQCEYWRLLSDEHSDLICHGD